MLPNKDISEPLEFIPSLAERIFSGSEELDKIIFVTVSAKEVLQADGLARVTLSRSQVKSFKVEYLGVDGLELYEEGLLPLCLPTRKITIIDWGKLSPESRPLAALTWIVVRYKNGKRKKVAELSQGKIEGGVFKFLQVAAVNKLLNNVYLDKEEL